MAPDASGATSVLYAQTRTSSIESRRQQHQAASANPTKLSCKQLPESVYDWINDLEQTRLTIYPALRDTVYLDHAASQPAPQQPIIDFARDVASTLYSNPHSRSTSAQQTNQTIDHTRSRVLHDLFGYSDNITSTHATDYDVVFTSGATASIKLVADGFNWHKPQTLTPLGDNYSRFIYLKQSHTSLVGIRGVALARNATVLALDSVEQLLQAVADVNCPHAQRHTLVAYPAQCNVTGSRLGTDLCRAIKRLNPSVKVLCDAAAYLSTSTLHIASIPLDEAPDYVACSFYKLFGWPTGLGALIVKRSAAHDIAHDPYFGGGTISAMSTSDPFWVAHRPVVATAVQDSVSPFPPVHDRFEAGTVPYLDVIALGHALEHHQRAFGSHDRVARHAIALANAARSKLSALRHFNNAPVVRIYTGLALESSKEALGPVIAMTLYDSLGKAIGHVDVDKLATLNGIQLRTGGLCNTGIWSRISGLDDDDLVKLKDLGRACWDDQQFDDNGAPLGLVRISFGASSTMSDVDAFVEFVKRFFVQPEPLDQYRTIRQDKQDADQVILDRLTVFPIKSCAGFQVSSWPIVETGLVHDREWMLVDADTGRAMSQKRWPRMVLIRPGLDLDKGVLTIDATGMPTLTIPLSPSPSLNLPCGDTARARVCGDVVPISRADPSTDSWFSTFLNHPCQLHRISNAQSRHVHSHTSSSPLETTIPLPLLLSNESPFLMISSGSVDQVNDWISSNEQTSSSSNNKISSSCFRANLQLSGLIEPFVEDEIELVKVGDQVFTSLGKCRRCLMVSIDQETGTKTKEPFNCLNLHRKDADTGRIHFGVHLMWRRDLSVTGDDNAQARLSTGDAVEVRWKQRLA
ncbi:hypothetical protein ACM66B_002474 [Microbotryomycetes sp. NB124-2]